LGRFEGGKSKSAAASRGDSSEFLSKRSDIRGEADLTTGVLLKFVELDAVVTVI
jgi:hypothetical protein